MLRFGRQRGLTLAFIVGSLAAAPMLAGPALAAPEKVVLEQAEAQRQGLIDTMKDLVSIESGSKDPEGLAKIAALIAERLKALGGDVEVIEPKDVYRMQDTPE